MGSYVKQLKTLGYPLEDTASQCGEHEEAVFKAGFNAGVVSAIAIVREADAECRGLKKEVKRLQVIDRATP